MPAILLNLMSVLKVMQNISLQHCFNIIKLLSVFKCHLTKWNPTNPHPPLSISADSIKGKRSSVQHKRRYFGIQSGILNHIDFNCIVKNTFSYFYMMIIIHYLIFCSTVEKKMFGTTWGWENDRIIFISLSFGLFKIWYVVHFKTKYIMQCYETLFILFWIRR